MKRIYQKFKERFLSSEYSKSILKVFTGSTFAFALSFLLLPVISRIYPPAEYGNFQVMLSLVTILSVLAALKYETAIVLPKSESERNDIFLLCILLLFSSTIIVGTGFYIGGDFVLDLLDAEGLKPYILYMILLYFFIGLFQITRYNFIAQKKYGQLSINNIVNSAVINGGKVGLGYWKPVFSSLFWGHLAGVIIASLYALFVVDFSSKSSWKRLRIVALKYKKFFIFEMPGVFLLSLTVKLPIFFISKYHGTEAAGLYAMAALIIDAPLDLIAKSVKEVFYKTAAEKTLINRNELRKFYAKNLKSLSALGVFAIIFVLIFSDLIVETLLGEEWMPVSWMMKILVVAKLFHFVSNVTASALRIINKQNLYFSMMIVFFISRAAFLWIFNDDLNIMIMALAGSTIFFYLIYNFFAIKKLKLFTRYDT